MKISFFLFILPISMSFAQEIVNQSELQLSEIMKGNDFIGHSPTNIRWSIEGDAILYNQRSHSSEMSNLYSIPFNGLSAQQIEPSQEDKQTSAIHSLHNYPTEYFIERGNLVEYNRKTKQKQWIWKTANHISSLQRYPSNPDAIYFRVSNDIYVFNTETRSTIQLVEFSEKSPEKPEAASSHFEVEEESLFQYIQEEVEYDKRFEERSKIRSKNTSIPVVYTGTSSFSQIQVSPDGRYVSYRIDEYSSVENTHVEYHISKDGHTSIQNARPKVSDNDPNHTLMIYDILQDTSYKVAFNELPDIRKKGEYYTDYNDTEQLFEADRKIVMHQLIFSPDGKQQIVDVRSYDNKDRWIASISLNDGTISIIDHQHDEAWIGGPGISNWNRGRGTLGWINDQHVYFQSEVSGYSHLYAHNIPTQTTTALTSGNWEVHSAQLSKKRNVFFVTANRIHPGNREFYHLEIQSKKLIPILTSTGNHEVVVSPDEKHLAVRYSSKTTPWEIYSAPNKSGALLKQLTHSTSQEFQAYKWFNPEIIQIDNTGNTTSYARLYTPDEQQKNGAAIIFVHGAGYLQNAHNYWSGYYREYMFHNLLRDNGFTVLDIDYRASKGYGRDHRTAIYRHMGGADLDDQLSGKQFLMDSLGIDPNRVGIYGGSYGGFITLMALLTKPGVFKCGAALRSVTDWFHYNHEYTSNILNYPSSDPDAYKKSSPIYFAENLQDRLLILHGMVDDNVQFQDVVRLSQRFIELGKKNWELAVYPVEAHGFVKSYSWTDEYRRIYELFYEELILKK